jgi:hypothetical protein
MKGMVRFLAWGVGLFAAFPVSASILSGPIVNPANGHTYYLLDQAFWTTAEAEAVSLGGHLATVNDAAEDAFIFSNFAPLISPSGQNRSLLIGLNDVAAEGTFVWVSGEPVGYTNWQTGQPNADRFDSDYVGIYVTFGTPGTWHDLLNNGDFGDVTYGVVEVVPEPCVGLLAACALALGRRRPRHSKRA